MHRRRCLAAAALACLPAAALRAQPAGSASAGPRHTISAATLHQALGARFPQRWDLGGLLQLQLDAPALLLLPARNRLGATLQAQVAGAPRAAGQGGELDLLVALRYEPTDRSVRAHSPELLAIRWPGLPREAIALLQQVAPQIAQDALGEVVLHQLTDQDLSLADTMGFEPRTLTVLESGLVVGFGPKQRVP